MKYLFMMGALCVLCFVDIDECKEGTANCEQVCENRNGSFVCSCYDGYTLNTDDKTCNISKSRVVGSSIQADIYSTTGRNK